jgi:hypothetical protein
MKTRRKRRGNNQCNSVCRNDEAIQVQAGYIQPGSRGVRTHRIKGDVLTQIDQRVMFGPPNTFE